MLLCVFDVSQACNNFSAGQAGNQGEDQCLMTLTVL